MAAAHARGHQAIPHVPGTAPIVWLEGRPIDRRAFLAAALRLAGELPAARHLINLCERRELFLLTSLAALLSARTIVLPPNRAPGTVTHFEALFAQSARSDETRAAAALAGAANTSLHPSQVLSEVAPEHVVVVPSTSGTTGEPCTHPKRWHSLIATTRFNEARIREQLPGGDNGRTLSLVASVPAWHMYGFETSVLLPLLADVAVSAARPVLPADVVTSLAALPTPRVLVSTPVHLRALLASDVELPPLAQVISATAPLDRALAAAVERRFATRVLEMFGATETSVFGTRRTACEDTWHAYPGLVLEPLADATRVSAPWLEEPRVLQDVLEPHADGRFIVRGRSADLIEVGGKRASLADLKRRLLAIPGVRDAEVFLTETPEAGMAQRVAALVVAPGLTTESIRGVLVQGIDPVFVPRPLLQVSEVPRNDIGKAPRTALLAALRAGRER